MKKYLVNTDTPPSIMNHDPQQATDEIERLKEEQDFDTYLSEKVTHRIVSKECIHDRVRIDRIKGSILKNIISDVDTNLVRIILSQDPLEGHNNHKNLNLAKNKCKFKGEDTVAKKLRTVIEKSYGCDSKYNKLVRKKVTGCMTTIHAIVNDFEVEEI